MLKIKNTILFLIILAILATPLFTFSEFIAMMQGSYVVNVEVSSGLDIKIIKDLILVIILALSFFYLCLSGKIKIFKGVLFFLVIAVGFFLGLLNNGFSFTLISLRIYLPFLLIIVVLNVFHKDDYDKIYRYLIYYLLFFEIIVAFAQIFMGVGGGFSFLGLFKRVLGTFAYSNAFAFFLVLCISILLSNPELKCRKIFIVISSFLVFASGSGAGIVLLLLLYCLFFLFMEGWIDRRLKRLIVISSIIFLGMIILFLPIISGRDEVYSVSGAGRITMFMNSFNKADPLAIWVGRGLGVGSNATKYLFDKGLIVESSDVFMSDSLYTALFSQVGLIGLFIWLIFNVYIIYLSFIREYLLGIIFFIIYICYNFSGVAFEVFPINWLFPIIIGQLFSLKLYKGVV